MPNSHIPKVGPPDHWTRRPASKPGWVYQPKPGDETKATLDMVNGVGDEKEIRGGRPEPTNNTNGS